MPEEITHNWEQRLREARAAKAASALAYVTVIQDANRIGGLGASAIATALGIRDRTQITRYLRREGTPATPEPPRLPLVIYLRATHRAETTWLRMRQAMAARGWYTTGSEQQAWLLGRAGCRVVEVNFSHDPDCGASSPVYVDMVEVRLLRALAEQRLPEPRYVPLRDMLPTGESLRLEREHPDVVGWQVRADRDTGICWRTLGSVSEPALERWDDSATDQAGAYVLDEQRVVLLVANLLDIPDDDEQMEDWHAYQRG